MAKTAEILSKLSTRPDFSPVMRGSLAFKIGEYIPAISILENYCSDKYDYRRAFYLTAALYAIHPYHKEDGKTLAQVLSYQASEADKRRFTRLLYCDFEQIAVLLPREITRLKQQAFDYNRLYTDLAYWDVDYDNITFRWAKYFFSYTSGGTNND